jgi:hypothetical protein
VSGFGRIILFGAITATVAGIAGLRAQTQLMDPKDAPKIFASTCSACHKSPQGLAKSGQVAGFLRQHYTTGPEMSAAMAAYLVAAGAAPAAKKGAASEAAAARTKGKKVEQASATPADQTTAEAKGRSLRGKQRHTKSQDEPPALRPAQPAAPEPAIREAAAPAAAAGSNEPPVAAAPEPAGPPLVVFDLPLPAMPEVPPPELTHSAFSSAPLP